MTTVWQKLHADRVREIERLQQELDDIKAVLVSAGDSKADEILEQGMIRVIDQLVATGDSERAKFRAVNIAVGYAVCKVVQHLSKELPDDDS